MNNLESSLAKNLLDQKESSIALENSNQTGSLTFLPHVLGMKSQNSLRSELNVNYINT